MKKIFRYNGLEGQVFWNEKTYPAKQGHTYRFVTVTFPGTGQRKGTELTWTSDLGWTKNGGYNWVPAVTEALGF